ncbi:MAG TPA: hypothetical protein VN764_00135 [Polyangiaceae bacterium]|nr:hypothetical protein [Polyangiaceae bacterium]
MDGRCRLLWEFPSVEHLALQIATNLRKGRAFIEGDHKLEVRQQCELVLVHPISSAQIALPAEAVYLSASPQFGVGLEILESAERLNEQLHEFLTLNSQAEPDPGLVAPDRAEMTSAPDEVDPLLASDDEVFELDPVAERSSDGPREELPGDSLPPSSQVVLPAGARVRTLNAAGRERMARHGTLSERVALERAFGPAVWEALLNNPLLSTAEVARIAKNHTASQPILNTIVSNPGWLTKPEVRRALLSNPRLLESQVERTLRALPQSELRLVLRQTAYPLRVRNVAKRLLGG